MPSNDFLPFATGAGANVVSQPNYAADPSTGAGFSAGIALSAKLNKVWRQSSFISSGLAQFVMDQTGQDVLDNGDLASFVQKLEQSFVSLNPRKMLYEWTVFYVSMSGNDGNDGLSPSTAFRTLQGIANHLGRNIDQNGQGVTIQLAAGTYDGVNFYIPMLGAAWVIVQGVAGNRAAVTINGVNREAFAVCNGNQIWLWDVTLTTSNPGAFEQAGWGMFVSGGNSSCAFGEVAFGACSSGHILAQCGAYARGCYDYSITGGAMFHYAAAHGGIVSVAGLPTPDWSLSRAVEDYKNGGPKILEDVRLPSRVPFEVAGMNKPEARASYPPMIVTVSGNPNFSQCFTAAFNMGQCHGFSWYGVSYVGTATGYKFLTVRHALIDSGSSGNVNYFPGDTAGIADGPTYGLYV